MQLIALAVYNSSGDRREVWFQAGLNVITGNSETGKSALLDMVEYCLGRDTLIMPVGPITETVVWYGLLVQLPGQQAFIGRPRPDTGHASTQRAMLEFGTNLELPDFPRLVVNADTSTVREQLGRAIGIDENITDPVAGTPAFEANLGHATLLCLQRQSEIANRDLLFHRQGEEGMHRAIQETLPYFIGAIGRDRALLRQRLLSAKRVLRGAEAELQRAEGADAEVEVKTRGLVAEAVAAGLVSGDVPESSAAALSALAAAVTVPLETVALDDSEAAERQRLMRLREDLRGELRQLGQERAVLDAIEGDEADYEAVVGRQTSRLRSLELVGSDSSEDPSGCPICGSALAEPDPTVEELRATATQLAQQAGTFGLARPRRREALAEIEQAADELRRRIQGLDDALDALESAQRSTTAGRAFRERQAFLQGRIQHYLESVSMTEANALAGLRERVRLRSLAVRELEDQLDPDEEREQLQSRLALIGRDMTTWADQLGLEHSEQGVRLDLRRLTVVADTASGPAPLNRIGSAANWIGYHLVAHLALQKYFVEQDRPVPHFLMIDQPTQAYYPSDVEVEAGVPTADSDRLAVLHLFELISQVVAASAGALQVIVCDHANLQQDWFQAAIVKNWREGERLIPQSWIAAT